MVLVDLHGGEPATAGGVIAGSRSPVLMSRGAAAGSSPQTNTRALRAHSSPAHRAPASCATRFKCCTAHVVDYGLFASRPGLYVRQV